ncbi:MAG: PilZ domain-containing protein [Candidatus Omnitrophica bacterium]|nr:PilZ domain-containing protein [Candidatus Omnitrophota bacterium]
MTDSPPLDRRRYVRLERQHMLRHEKYEFQIVEEREAFEEGMLKNYSHNGALFETVTKYRVGDVVKLAITIPGWERYKKEFYKEDRTSRAEPVVVLACVVRVETLVSDRIYDTGVQFVSIDEGDRWSLMRQIKAQVENG